MNNKSILLLKTLLLSTSQINIFKNTTDKKKKSKVIGNFVGVCLIYAMIMVYSVAMCVGYGYVGIIEAAPLMCALTVSSIAFLFTVFKTNGYLFNFKEYDMLMSLPFDVRSVAACKFLYMYVKSLPWYLSISFAMMIGYGIFARPFIGIYFIWIILSFFIPVIPMLFAAFIGFLIALISSGFRKSNIIQTILTLIFVLFCFSLRFIIEAIFREDKVEATLEKTYDATRKAAGIYLPAGWFSDAITKGDLLSFLFIIVATVALFMLVFQIVGSSYRNINSAMKSHAAAKNYKMTTQKKRSVVNAIAYKELKRLTGSTAYTVNAAMGEILAIILGIVTLVIGFDKIIATLTNGAEFDYMLLQPSIPFIVYLLVGMVATTACSPSLEGKNYWIVQSFPIEKKTLYQGKMLFNMYMTVPCMVFTTLCICISSGVPVLNTILYLILGFALCCFSTSWGCVCGIRHMRLDWENEIEVIKQGAAMVCYMLPNMLVVMGLTVGVVFLGMRINHCLLALGFIIIVSLLAILSYKRVMSLSKE